MIFVSKNLDWLVFGYVLQTIVPQAILVAAKRGMVITSLIWIPMSVHMLKHKDDKMNIYVKDTCSGTVTVKKMTRKTVALIEICVLTNVLSRVKNGTASKRILTMMMTQLLICTGMIYEISRNIFKVAMNLRSPTMTMEEILMRT
jgi:mannitol-specific phosphotransferase system IIBC component